jgi:hypothetical protein
MGASMSNRGPDIVRRDENGAPVAVIEIKSTMRPEDRAFFLRQLGDYLRESGSARYSILVDPLDIEVFEGDPAEHHSWMLRTPEILTRYDAHFSERRDIYEGYLNTLITAWLDDLSFHASRKRFPEEDRLPKGLLDALRAA